MARNTGLPAIIPIIMAANISRKCRQKGEIRTVRLMLAGPG
jgi:hypothetical protein